MAIPEQAFTDDPPIRHTDGLDYAVLDPTKLDFTGPNIVFGKKTHATRVHIAKPGEVICAQPGGFSEVADYTAAGGEIVLTNELHNGRIDSYVLRTQDGHPVGMDVLEEHYALIGGDIHGEGAYYCPIDPCVPLLHEAIDRPTCIMNEYGVGIHAFYKEGATLKLLHGKVSGIERDAFDETWQLTTRRGRIMAGTPNTAMSR